MAIEFRHATLLNGLNIIGEVNPDSHSAAAGFFVKTGARDEDAAVMGVSHFLEHMMFKGTAKRTAQDVDRDFDSIGAQHNAYTTSELTAFWAHCLPEHLPAAAEILADIMRPAIRQEDFDDEKNVILEEIAMYDDHPFWNLYERSMEVYYGAHPLSHRVLGTKDTVTNLPRDRMEAYFTNRYSADNTVLALAGDLNFDATVEQVTSLCGHWNTTDTRRVHSEASTASSEFTLKSEKINRHYMLMIAPAPAMGDDRRYAASMLAQILGDTDGSRLYWALIETGLAEEAQSQYDGRDGLGEYMVYASCTPADADQVRDIALREIDELVDSICEDDLERVRSKIATGVTLHGELPGGRMKRLGRQWTYFGEYRSLEDELATIEAVTLNDLRRVHEEFPLTPVVTGHLTPK